MVAVILIVFFTVLVAVLYSRRNPQTVVDPRGPISMQVDRARERAEEDDS